MVQTNTEMAKEVVSGGCIKKGAGAIVIRRIQTGTEERADP